MRTLLVLPIEPHETRYTSEWRHYVPAQIAGYAKKHGLKARVFRDAAAYMAAECDSDTLNIVSLPGDGGAQSPSAGAFINFASTNRWKCEQISAFVTLIEAGLVRSGDKVLVTDAWHPGILQLAYLRDLCGIRFEISAIWHAGSYDPWDFLGRNIPDKRWSYAAERALFWAIDRNYFTTRFHMELFAYELGLAPDDVGSRSVLCGYPNEYLWDSLPPHRVPASERPDLILFPHRLAPEKQADIFRDLAVTMPQYEWVVCQDAPLTKAEYHALLGRAKLSFSAALQETLGIAQRRRT